MGRTLDELAETMTAREFGMHAVLEHRDPLGSAAYPFAVLLAALANGELKPPNGRQAWSPSDFEIDAWPTVQPAREEPGPMTQEQAIAAARAAGMKIL
jgi:hypothetical protein